MVRARGETARLPSSQTGRIPTLKTRCHDSYGLRTPARPHLGRSRHEPPRATFSAAHRRSARRPRYTGRGGNSMLSIRRHCRSYHRPTVVGWLPTFACMKFPSSTWSIRGMNASQSATLSLTCGSTLRPQELGRDIGQVLYGPKSASSGPNHIGRATATCRPFPFRLGRKSEMRPDFSLSHLQKPTASCQLTRITGWSAGSPDTRVGYDLCAKVDEATVVFFVIQSVERVCHLGGHHPERLFDGHFRAEARRDNRRRLPSRTSRQGF